MDTALKMALSPSSEDEMTRSNRETVGLSIRNLGLGISNGVQQNGHAMASPFEEMGISLPEQQKANQFGEEKGFR
jgi:MFS superfamily sulfate permease-like transporter